MQQQRVAVDPGVLAGVQCHTDVAWRGGGLCAGHALLEQGAHRHRRRVLQDTPRFERGQLHHAIDELLDARCFALDVGYETGTIGRRHRGLVQQLGRAADRRQRALQLVRQGLHIVGHIVAAGQGIAHFAVGRTERTQRTPAQTRQAEAALGAHVAHIVCNQAEGPHQPHRQQRHQQGHGEHRGRADEQGLLACGIDELPEALRWLAHADRADDRTLSAQRRGDVHHCRLGIVGHVGCGARTVEAFQRELHIAPGRVIGTDGAAQGIEDHPAARIDDGQAQLDARLAKAEDLGVEFARIKVAEHGHQGIDVDHRLGQGALFAPALLDLRGHQMRHLDKRLLGRLAVARVDVGQQAPHQQAHADGVGQQDGGEDAIALRQWRPPPAEYIERPPEGVRAGLARPCARPVRRLTVVARADLPPARSPHRGGCGSARGPAPRLSTSRAGSSHAHRRCGPGFRWRRPTPDPAGVRA